MIVSSSYIQTCYLELEETKEFSLLGVSSAFPHVFELTCFSLESNRGQVYTEASLLWLHSRCRCVSPRFHQITDGNVNEGAEQRCYEVHFVICSVSPNQWRRCDTFLSLNYPPRSHLHRLLSR